MRIDKRFLLVFTLLAVCLSGLFAGGKNTMLENQDVRLQNFFAKMRRGETVRVVALGGSITTGYSANPPSSNGWAGRTGNWLIELGKETGSEVIFVNRGVSGTDSAFAIARLDDHVLSLNPDLVLLEYAMNDQWLHQSTRQRTYESIVRKILGTTDSAILALFVNERKAPYSSNQAEEKLICKKYGVPFVSWKDSLFEENKTASFEPFFDGEETVHPNNAGHEKIAQFMTAKLNSIWEALPSDSEIKAVSRELPSRIFDGGFEKAKYFASDNITPVANDSWKVGSPVHNEWQKHGNSHRGWESNTPGSEIVFEVEGSTVGITYCESDQFTDAVAWVEYENGKTSPKVNLACYQVYRKGYYGWAYKEIVDVDTVQKFKLHVQKTKQAGSETKKCNITGILVAGEKN